MNAAVIHLLLGLLAAVSFLLLVLPGIFFAAPLGIAVMGAAYVLLLAGTGNTCRRCGYDHSGIDAAVCPECGEPRG